MDFKNWLEAKDLKDVASKVVFTDGRKILILKRSKENKWTLPGGHQKEGETSWDAAKRETKEEIGHDLTEKPYAKERIGPTEMTVYFTKIDKPFDCKLDHEHSDWKWVGLDQLGEFPLDRFIANNLEIFLDKSQQGGT